MTGILATQLEVILFSNYISMICTIILIFIPWKQGPKKWVKYAPYLFFFLMITVYMIIPIANMAFAAALWGIPNIPSKTSVYESWVVFYFIVNISRVLSFFTQIRRTFLREARVFHSIQILHENMEVEKF